MGLSSLGTLQALPVGCDPIPFYLIPVWDAIGDSDYGHH